MTIEPKQSTQQPAITQPRQQPSPFQNQNVEKALMEPGKYEVTQDQTFEVVLYVKEYKGRWVLTEKKTTGSEEHKVIFRVWSFEEMVDLRRKATSTDQNRKSLIDNDLLNRLKIQKLLQSWTFDKDNPRLKIHRIQGTLTDESWRAFTKLSPNIAQKIIDEMNFILEYGG